MGWGASRCWRSLDSLGFGWVHRAGWLGVGLGLGIWGGHFVVGVVGVKKIFRACGHFVLKVSGQYALSKRYRLVQSLIEQHSQKFGVRVYRHAIHTDHIHMLVKLPK